MKILVVGDGPINEEELVSLGNEIEYLDLRRGLEEGTNLLDSYQDSHPELIPGVRNTIKDINPDKIVVLGRLEGYLWVGTVVCRFFGQFNSWLDQWHNPYGITEIMVGERKVKLYAIESLADWSVTKG